MMALRDWGTFEDKLERSPPGAGEHDGDSDHLLTHRVFSGRDGQEWLKRMRMRKFAAPIDPNITDAALRYLEGQRSLLREIDSLMQKAREEMERMDRAGKTPVR